MSRTRKTAAQRREEQAVKAQAEQQAQHDTPPVNAAPIEVDPPEKAPVDTPADKVAVENKPGPAMPSYGGLPTPDVSRS